MLQVRNLSDDVHARLKERAKAARMSLSDYVASELAKLVSVPTMDEALARMKAHRERFGPSKITTEEIVRAVREERDGDHHE